MGKRILIIIFLFILLAGFVSAEDCRGMKKDLNLKINVGIYDKIPNGENFTFEKSKFQPNDEDQIVKQGNVLLIESFSVSVNSSYCYNSGDKIKVLIYSPEDYPNTTSTLFEIPIDFENASFMYFFNAIQPITTKENNKYRYLIFSKNESIEDLNYISLDKIGEWDMQVRLVNENESIKGNFNNLVFNDGSSIITINVLDRLDVVQLETLKQIREDSENSFWVVFAIGIATIVFMWLIPFCTERKKQKSLLKSLLVELNKISNEKKDEEGNLQWFGKTTKNLHGIWILNVSVYMEGLNGFEELKKNLVDISQKIEMLNRFAFSGLERNKFFKDLIDETIKKVEKSKKFIE